MASPIVGWIDSPDFDRHETPPGHPERRERLEAIRATLSAASGLRKAAPHPVDPALLSRVHAADYMARIERLAVAGGGALDADTHLGPHSLPAARLAAGAVVDAVGRVLDADWTRAFCSVRPPGHHASVARGMGFCLFNNVAVGAMAALERGDVGRVAILDWDAHHGNGTQDIFYADSRVFYASWHQFPFYPGTGAASEVGEGAGRGTTLNCPLPAGAGDSELLGAWTERIEPALTRFDPDLLLLSAGFDANARDPLAQLDVTTGGFAELSARVVAWSEAHCGGKIVSVLEGGYDLQALGDDVRAHVDAMCIRG